MLTVLVRGVGVNALNGWTIALGLVSAVVLIRAERFTDAIAGAALLVIAATPALIGGMGLLYVPSVGFAAVGAAKSRGAASQPSS